MKSRFSTGGLVYSTDAGRMCPTCRKPVAQCTCKAAAARP
jgi:translation initiation factor 1